MLEIPFVECDQKRAKVLSVILSYHARDLGFSPAELGAACMNILEALAVTMLEDEEFSERLRDAERKRS